MNKNCFAYGRENQCNVLKTPICRKGECRFFKTKQQWEDDHLKSKKRLASLSKDFQLYISDKYKIAKCQKDGV